MYQAVINSEVPAIMPAFLCLCLCLSLNLYLNLSLNDFYHYLHKGVFDQVKRF